MSVRQGEDLVAVRGRATRRLDSVAGQEAVEGGGLFLEVVEETADDVVGDAAGEIEVGFQGRVGVLGRPGATPPGVNLAFVEFQVFSFSSGCSVKTISSMMSLP